MQLTSLHTEADGRDLSAVYYLPKNDADAASFQVTISTNTSLISLSLSPLGLAVDEQFRDIRICLIHPSGHSDIWISSGYQNPGPLSAVVLV